MPPSEHAPGTVFETGTLERQTADGPEEVAYHIQILDAPFLPQVETLQASIVANIAEPELFAECSHERLRAVLTENGRVLGTCVGDELAGYIVAYFPGDDEENLGRDLGVPASEYARVVHLESGVVDPAYRGNFLALKMNRYALWTLQSLQMKHVCATAWPHNLFSVRVLFSTGMVIRFLKEKYNGKLRYIFHRNLHEPLFDAPTRCVTIPTSQRAAQEKILAHGLCGYALQEDGEGASIVYGRPAPLHL